MTHPARPPLLTRPFLQVIALQVSYSAAMGCFVLFPKFLASEFDAAPHQIGNAQAAFSLTNVLIVPLVGAGVDRLGRRAFLLLGSLVFTVAAIGFARVEVMGPAVYALRLLQGASWAFVYVSSATLIADNAPPQRLSQALALFGACVHLTSGAVPPLVEIASERLGWSAVFSAAAGLSLVSAALSLGVARRPAGGRGEGPQIGLGEVLRRPSVRHTIAVTAGIGLALSTLTTFIQPFALERGITRIGGYFAAYSLTTVAVRLVLGAWIDRADRHRVAALTSTAYVALLLGALLLSTPAMVVFGILLGLAHGLFMPAFHAMNLTGAGPQERGKVVAVLSGSLNMGVGMGTAGLGLLAGQIGYAGIFPVAALLATISPLLLWLRPGAERWSAAGPRPRVVQGAPGVEGDAKRR